MTSGRTGGSSREPVATTHEILPGALIAGKFRVERIVGRGGMGVVVEATNVQLDQKVALKLLASRSEDPAVAERFGREARAAARLRSDHVARVYDVGKDTLHGPFIVMELLEGRTLADVIAVGRVPVHRAIEYVIDACEGLAEAHARGIVHQDVKPANLFLVTDTDGRPSIKLLDFGIATVRSSEREADAGSSHPSTGTPAYLAPEQLRGGRAADHRADIWALGCVLYELIVGERPFPATRFTELVTRILESRPEPIPATIEVPAPIAAAIERCLEKDPSKRFASTGELALTLLPFARRRAHSSVSRAIAHVKASGLDPALEMPSSMPPRPSDDAIELPSSAQLRAPGVPSFSRDDFAPAPGGLVGGADALASGSESTSARSRRGLALGALGALILLGASTAWLFSDGALSDSPPPSPASSSAGANSIEGPLPAVPSTRAEAEATPALAANPPPSTADGAADAAVRLAAGPPSARAATPHGRATPMKAAQPRSSGPTVPSAPAAPSETEIRHQR